MAVRPFVLKAITPSRGGAEAHLRQAGDAVLVERGSPRWLVMQCPCGCNDVIPINLDPRSGPAWELYGSREHGISVFPSVWRDTGCKSHFIIWYGRILLFADFSDEEDVDLPLSILEALASRVREQLTDELVHFREIAQRLRAIPWDVQYICRQLTRNGYAREGAGKKRGQFARKP
jgi:hypothetical protein